MRNNKLSVWQNNLDIYYLYSILKNLKSINSKNMQGFMPIVITFKKEDFQHKSVNMS